MLEPRWGAQSILLLTGGPVFFGFRNPGDIGDICVTGWPFIRNEGMESYHNQCIASFPHVIRVTQITFNIPYSNMVVSQKIRKPKIT